MDNQHRFWRRLIMITAGANVLSLNCVTYCSLPHLPFFAALSFNYDVCTVIMGVITIIGSLSRSITVFCCFALMSTRHFHYWYRVLACVVCNFYHTRGRTIPCVCFASLHQIISMQSPSLGQSSFASSAPSLSTSLWFLPIFCPTGIKRIIAQFALNNETILLALLKSFSPKWFCRQVCSHLFLLFVGTQTRLVFLL